MGYTHDNTPLTTSIAMTEKVSKSDAHNVTRTPLEIAIKLEKEMLFEYNFQCEELSREHQKLETLNESIKNRNKLLRAFETSLESFRTMANESQLTVGPDIHSPVPFGGKSHLNTNSY